MAPRKRGEFYMLWRMMNEHPINVQVQTITVTVYNAILYLNSVSEYIRAFTLKGYVKM